jgi:hypothetical protein
MTHLDTSNISYGQKKGRESNWQFDSQPLKVRNRLDFSISLRAGGVRHTIAKLLTRATTMLETSSQSKVYTQSYGPRKSRGFQFWKFRDSHLGVLGQNDIWALVP